MTIRENRTFGAPWRHIHISKPCWSHTITLRSDVIRASLSSSSLPGLFPTVSLMDVMWGYSNLLAEEILHSSSFLQELQSGHLTERCYASFIQQEALYLHRISSTLEVRGHHLSLLCLLVSLFLSFYLFSSFCAVLTLHKYAVILKIFVQQLETTYL